MRRGVVMAAVILLSTLVISPSTSASDIEDDNDDDNDGYSNEIEIECGSNTTDTNDTPPDLDGDGVCNLMDPDMDGDGFDDAIETNTGIFISTEDSGTDPSNPDTDGDGYCDGPVSPNYSNCTAIRDIFPTDASAHLDNDGDGDPDTITGNSTTGLIEDLDDDNDGASDIAEIDCKTNPLDASDTPDTDSDGNCLHSELDPERLLEWNWGWCFCLVFFLMLLLLVPVVIQKNKFLLVLKTSSEPEKTD